MIERRQTADRPGPHSGAEGSLEFCAELDIFKAAAQFRAKGRVRVDNLLAAPSAERLHACLAGEVPWRLTYNEGQDNIVVAEHCVGDEAARHALMQSIVARARTHFQYLFQTYPMVTAYLAGDDPDLFLHRVLEWLNTPHTLNLLRLITGIGGTYKADAQATLYAPGHFLKVHDDIGTDSQGRRVAYVLGMTRDWRADWGGQLQFLNTDGQIEEAWMPGFNTLDLFLVPKAHTVSYVAPFAREPRLAITGWLCVK